MRASVKSWVAFKRHPHSRKCIVKHNFIFLVSNSTSVTGINIYSFIVFTTFYYYGQSTWTFGINFLVLNLLLWCAFGHSHSLTHSHWKLHQIHTLSPYNMFVGRWWGNRNITATTAVHHRHTIKCRVEVSYDQTGGTAVGGNINDKIIFHHLNSESNVMSSVWYVVMEWERNNVWSQLVLNKESLHVWFESGLGWRRLRCRDMGFRQFVIGSRKT